VADDFPVAEDVFHFWASADVVNDHVRAGLRGLAVDDHADKRDVAPKS
jgi:hypothetical protein